MRREIDSNVPVIYVVMYNCGQYEDRSEGPVAAYTKREDAEKFIEDHKKWQEHIEEIAIKSPRYEFYSAYLADENPDKDLYDNLHQEYTEWIWKETFGDRESEDIKQEEWIKYDEIDEKEEFKKFLMMKGYSEEVAEATIIYNDHDEYSEYNTYYNIEEINLYGSEK